MTQEPETLFYLIKARNCIQINTDPQKRCYNGCHKEIELFWSEWYTLDFAKTTEKAKQRIKFWEEINNIAVKDRGPSAKSEFKIIKE